MNRDESAQLLAIMAAPHPWDVPDDQAEVWHRAALERVDFELGLEAAVRLVETMEKMPTPAAFNAMVTTIGRERYAEQRQLAAQSEGRLLDPGTGLTDKVRQVIADLRASFATANGTRGHWHGGPDPCPVCGGVAPDVLRRMTPDARDRVLAVQASRSARRKADQGSLG